MEISSNINAVPSQMGALSQQLSKQLDVTQTNLSNLNSGSTDVEQMKALALQAAQLSEAAPPHGVAPGKIHEFAQAAIDAIVGFINSLTVVWEPPRAAVPAPTTQQPQPQQQQQQSVIAKPATTQESAPQTPAPEVPTLAPALPEETVVTNPEPTSPSANSIAPRSLLPSSARIFEFTNKSEWHPGLFNQKAYVDLRPELQKRVAGIQILSPDGSTVIATGKLERVGSDGRPRFRFDKTAASIPQGAIIMANLTNNDGVRYIELDRPSRAFKW